MNYLALSRTRNDLRFYSTDLELGNFLANFSDIDQTGDKLFFGLNYDQKSMLINKYPVNTIILKVNVNTNNATAKTLELSSSGVEKLQNTYFCTPSGSRDFNYSQVTSDKVSANFTANKTCTIFIPDDDLKYQVSFNTIAFENNNSSDYNYLLELENSSGLTANFDLEFNFAAQLQVAPQEANFTKNGNTFIYSGVFNGKKQFAFKITKI